MFLRLKWVANICWPPVPWMDEFSSGVKIRNSQFLPRNQKRNRRLQRTPIPSRIFTLPRDWLWQRTTWYQSLYQFFSLFELKYLFCWSSINEENEMQSNYKRPVETKMNNRSQLKSVFCQVVQILFINYWWKTSVLKVTSNYLTKFVKSKKWDPSIVISWNEGSRNMPEKTLFITKTLHYILQMADKRFCSFVTQTSRVRSKTDIAITSMSVSRHDGATVMLGTESG